MQTLIFSKYQGSGNDFILIDDRKKTFPISEKFIEKLCHRKFGIGADGVILVQNSKIAKNYRMRIFNADGMEAKMCGNGFFCLMQYLVDVFNLPKNSPLEIETDQTIYTGFFEEDKKVLFFGETALPKEMIVDDMHLYYLQVGVEHAVCFVDDLKAIDVIELGKKIRHHKYFAPIGVNVSFAQIKDHKVFVRVFEKGVEAETLSCGTAAIATSLSVAKKYQFCSPIELHFPGGDVQVKFFLDQEIAKDVKLIGSSSSIFFGKIELNK